jgi:hypothetical protein
MGTYLIPVQQENDSLVFRDVLVKKIQVVEVSMEKPSSIFVSMLVFCPSLELFPNKR